MIWLFGIIVAQFIKLFGTTTQTKERAGGLQLKEIFLFSLFDL